MNAYDHFDFEHNGRTFRAELHYDSDMGAPWIEHDGHGIVSEWETRDKQPGEVIIKDDRGAHRFYDVTATTQRAKRDEWGLNDESRAALARRIGRAPTPGEVTAEAVRLDMERMRAWCNLASWLAAC